VSRLYRPRPSNRALGAVIAAGAFAVVVAIMVSPPLSDLVDLLWLKFKVTFGIG
jgi:hypothetical protein